MTVFSLSSLLLGMMVLAIERALRFVADHEGAAESCAVDLSSKRPELAYPADSGS